MAGDDIIVPLSSKSLQPAIICKVKKYLGIRGFSPSSIDFEGVQRYDRDEHDPIIINCRNGITISVAYSIVKKTKDDFASFMRAIDAIQ